MQPIISKRSSEIYESNSHPLLSKKSSEINQFKSLNYILTKLNELTISFRNKDENYNTQYSTKDEEDLNIESHINGIVISKHSMQKILELCGLSLNDLNNYLLYTVTEYQTVVNETIEQITTFNIEYKLLIKIIKNFFIAIGGEKAFTLGKDSLEKIFQMLQYDTNQKMEYLSIYEISEHEIEFNREIREALENHKKIEEEDDDGLDSNIEWDISPGVNIEKMNKLYFFDLENIILKIDKEKEKRRFKQFENKIEAPQSNIEAPNAEDDKVLNEIILDQTNKPINPKKPVKGKKEKTEKSSVNIEKIIEENKDKKNIFTILNNNNKKIEKIDKFLECKIKRYLLEILKGIEKENTIQEIDDDSIIIPFSISITTFGDVYVSGSCKELGCWKTSKAILLGKNNFRKNYYTKDIKIKKDSLPFEYKFFVLDKYSEISWIGEPFKNFKVSQKIISIIDSRRIDILQLFQLNIRYFNNVDKMNCWDIRKAPQIDTIISSKSDILFFQEVTLNQWKELDTHLSVIYENVGGYRNSDFNDEAIPIYYHKKKYKQIKSGQFWLSSTPSLRGSKTFGNYFPRVCTWLQLSFTSNNKSFLLFNTQLDHLNLKGNISLTKVLLETMDKIIKETEKNDFVILGGCLYCDEDDPLIKLIIENGFSKVKFNKHTFHDFTGTGYKTYDYIFYKNIENKKGIKLKKCYVYDSESIINKEKNIYISDHYPVSAEFEI